MNIVIIPAYNPNGQLLKLIDNLIKLKLSKIIIINDGSDQDSDIIFMKALDNGCHIFNHEFNQGKGASLKSGIKYASETFENIDGYITCDADGQHLAKDILNVSEKLNENHKSIILGSRDFKNKNTPRKSRFGNRFSADYFRLSTGICINDTQTGLRGIPYIYTDDALNIEGSRYDYEMNFLISMANKNINIIELPIETIYLENNQSSHFRPIVDSIRIYKQPLKFGIASLSSALIDITIFTILSNVLSHEIAILVLISTVVARIISGLYNFTLNRVWSFENSASIKHQFPKYLALYFAQLLLSISFVTMLSYMPVNLTIIKIFVDSILFICSYFIQKNWVFNTQNNSI